MRFAKLVKHARPPIKINPLDPGITVFSAENFKLEYGETHSFRTGIMVEIPEGSFGLLKENQTMGFKGVVVAGGIVTAKDVSELRVSLLNNHREAFEVLAGMPLAQLIIMADVKADDEAEEIDRETLTEEMKEVTDEASMEEKRLVATQQLDAVQGQIDRLTGEKKGRKAPRKEEEKKAQTLHQPPKP